VKYYVEREQGAIVPDSADSTVFVCANCARPGKLLTSSNRSRPVIPDFRLPGRVQQVIVPCTGRLQPEHVLRAFEAGSRIVSVIACKEDNCHYAEGSRRCALRIGFIKSILQEIGLGEGRLLFFSLPGSASEDMAFAAGTSADAISADAWNAQMDDLRARTIEAFNAFPKNPLRISSDMTPEYSFEDESDTSENDNDE
jgi:F420-non-reducing hydrogenase iron-sulfur subunit